MVPPSEDIGQGAGLGLAWGQVAFEDEHQHEVGLPDELGDVLGHESAAVLAGVLGDQAVLSPRQPDWDMLGQQGVLVMEMRGGLRREHLIQQEPHARSVRRASTAA